VSGTGGSQRGVISPETGGAGIANAGERIAKVMARAGLCSRRDAERWIAEGRVRVDGAILTSPAVTVTPESDIKVDGKPLAKPAPSRLWRYKPVGLVHDASRREGAGNNLRQAAPACRASSRSVG
jgi:23S rRNA pseudouridine2605 synthase